MERSRFLAKVDTVRRAGTLAYLRYKRIKGKKLYAAGFSLLPIGFGLLLFSSSRETAASDAADMSKFLILLAHAPDTLWGRWLIIAVAVTFLFLGFWANVADDRKRQEVDRKEIDEILRVPRTIMKQVAHQRALRIAAEELEKAEFYLSRLKDMITELKTGSITSWAFESKYDVAMTVSNIRGAVTHVASISATQIDTTRITTPSPTIHIIDAGQGGDFLPEGNRPFFEAYDCNIAVFESIVSQLKEAIPRKRDEVSQAMEEALRD